MARSLPAPALRLIYQWDRLRLAHLQRRLPGLRVRGPGSPHLRQARIELGPGAQIEVGPGFATERRRGNHLLVHEAGRLELGARTWLRTEYGANYLTVFENAHMEIGDDALINGAMLHAKGRIRIGSNALIGCGVRIIDSDLHDLDRDTPERTEPITLGDRVWIGADTLVLRGVTIGDDVVVAAGSIVTRDLPSRSLAVGSPARVLREIAPRTGCR